MADYFPRTDMMDDLRDTVIIPMVCYTPREGDKLYLESFSADIDKKTVSLHVDMEKLAKAMGHRPQNSGDGEKSVAGNTLRLIENLESGCLVDFHEKEYFKGF